MNLLLLGAVSGPLLGVLGPYAGFLVPPKTGGAGGVTLARDAVGSEVTRSKWLNAHKLNDRSLVQGINGEAHYLIVTEDGQLESYGLSAVCTHLGCVVPWVPSAQKFICPCHGSQYNKEGQVVRGPAPLSLALAHVNVLEDDKVVFEEWKESDFRNGEKPWWSK